MKNPIFKKILLTVYIMLSCITFFGQIDSTDLYNAVVQGGEIANTLRPQEWVKGIPNSVISGFIVAVSSFVYGLFHRKKEMKSLRKKGKLID